MANHWILTTKNMLEEVFMTVFLQLRHQRMKIGGTTFVKLPMPLEPYRGMQCLVMFIFNHYNEVGLVQVDNIYGIGRGLMSSKP